AIPATPAAPTLTGALTSSSPPHSVGPSRLPSRAISGHLGSSRVFFFSFSGGQCVDVSGRVPDAASDPQGLRPHHRPHRRRRRVAAAERHVASGGVRRDRGGEEGEPRAGRDVLSDARDGLLRRLELDHPLPRPLDAARLPRRADARAQLLRPIPGRLCARADAHLLPDTRRGRRPRRRGGKRRGWRVGRDGAAAGQLRADRGVRAPRTFASLADDGNSSQLLLKCEACLHERASVVICVSPFSTVCACLCVLGPGLYVFV
ncbi:hypothetical protein EMIHUDRAFT_439073, partial [Emiliania huxleyi CCMP1516]|uniref:Uncharacterized protein n=2 Tax=Emiliania huxleyi TaxID=2903 RepID=A0A0D3I0P9_EMIH1